MCYFMQSKYNLDEIWFQPSNHKNVSMDGRGKCKRPDSFRLHRHFLVGTEIMLFIGKPIGRSLMISSRVVKYNLDEIWLQSSNYKNVCLACRGKCKRADSFRLHMHFLVVGILFRITVKNMSCGDWWCPPGLANAVFALTLWAALLHLLLIPVIFPPCLWTNCLRSLLFLSCLLSESVLIVYNLLYCCEGHIFLFLCRWRSLFHSIAFLKACVDLTYILPNRCLPISIASCCGIQNLSHKCGNNARVAPRSEESL